jgi:23S rRNA (adenine2503-C2)-methyltransferase
MDNILNFTREELKERLTEYGMKKYTGDQVFEWLYKGAENFDELSNISKENREILKNNFKIYYPKIIKETKSQKDSTIKYLLELHEEYKIECVLMDYNYGYSLCISSQAGCKMGCSFCASTGIGFDRNLEAGEMAGQILAIMRKEKISIYSVVIMGIGEPLDNFENLVKFLYIINDNKGLNYSMRRITISTCGLAGEIDKLSEMKMQVNLSISLHSVFDDVRNSMMPINKKYPVDVLLSAAKNYVKLTGRRITFEYAVIEGVNDSSEDIEMLYKKLRNINCHINLIQINKVDIVKYNKVNKEKLLGFRDGLMKKGLLTTIRRNLGDDINAACGQLRKDNK